MRAHCVVESGEERLRQPGKLEEEHIPTTQELTRTRAEEPSHHRRMRDIEYGELRDALRMLERGAPGNGGAPIVSGEKDFLLGELIGDGDDVGDELGQSVGCHAGGLAAQVIAALVGDDDAKARRGQRFDLPAPAIPEFREAVEKKHNGTVFGASSNRVQAYCAILK